MFALKEAARHLQEPRWFDWYRLGASSDTFVTQAAMPCTCSTLAIRGRSSPTVTRTGQMHGNTEEHELLLDLLGRRLASCAL